jgi:hypothetical protein
MEVAEQTEIQVFRVYDAPIQPVVYQPCVEYVPVSPCTTCQVVPVQNTPSTTTVTTTTTITDY